MNGAKKKILYLSLTGMSEPLGRSQVLEYIYDIVNFFDVAILSCEKPHALLQTPGLSDEIKRHGVNWIHIPYSNRFGLFSASWQFFRFTVWAVVYVMRKKPDIVHARSLIPAAVALIVKSLFHIKTLFDIRGFFVDEKVDSNSLIKGSALYVFLKKIERFVFCNSDYIITLTQRGKTIIEQEYGIDSKLITVIPTCVNTALFKAVSIQEKVQLRQTLRLPQKKILVHHGDVKGWYDFRSEVALFREMYNKDKNVFLLILNRYQKGYIEKVLKDFHIEQEAYELRSVEFADIPSYLNACDLSLFFIKPTYSKQASHPTKFAENTACKLFSISNRGVGDMDFYAETYKTALLIDLPSLSFTLHETAVRTLELINNPAQRGSNDGYARLIRECFSNEIAIERYLSVYNILSH